MRRRGSPGPAGPNDGSAPARGLRMLDGKSGIDTMPARTEGAWLRLSEIRLVSVPRAHGGFSAVHGSRYSKRQSGSPQKSAPHPLSRRRDREDNGAGNL